MESSAHIFRTTIDRIAPDSALNQALQTASFTFSALLALNWNMGDAEDEFNEIEGGNPEAAKKQVSPASHTGGNFMPWDATAEYFDKLMLMKYLC